MFGWTQHRWLLLILLFALLICLVPLSPKALPVMGKPGVILPILMYHQLSKDPAHWNGYVLSPEQFEKDIQTLLDLHYTPVSARYQK